MTWLWAAVPIIVIAGALWLAVGMRRLVQNRMRIDTHDAAAVTRVREASAALGESLDGFKRREPPHEPGAK